MLAHLRDQWRTASGQLRFRDETWGSSGGQRDSSVYAILDNETIGQIDYSVYEGVIGIKHIQVHEDHRRQGIATKMWAYMRGVEHNAPIDPGMFTPDGSKWWAGMNPALKGKIVHYDPEVSDYVTSSKVAFGPTFGIPVKKVTPGTTSGGSGSKGWVSRSVMAYRGFGSWGELTDAMRRGTWRSSGTFSVKGEGDLQMAFNKNDVLRGSGMHGLRRTGFLGIMEADIDGLPYETHLSVDSDRYKLSGGQGLFYPDLGLGIGIISGVPLDRIRSIGVIEDGRVVKTLSLSQAAKLVEDGELSDNPAWMPEVKDKPESYTGWFATLGKTIHVSPNQRDTLCGKEVRGMALGHRPMNMAELLAYQKENLKGYRWCPTCFEKEGRNHTLPGTHEEMYRWQRSDQERERRRDLW